VIQDAVVVAPVLQEVVEARSNERGDLTPDRETGLKQFWRLGRLAGPLLHVDGR